MENLERIIAQHPFFTGLQKPYLDLAVGCASNTRFKTGEYIFREGAEANQFYLIRSGRVALEIAAPQQRPFVVQTLGEGDILGWSWLLPPYTWKFNARALEDTRALALDGKCLRGKCEQNHDLGYELFKRFAQIIVKRLEVTSFQLLDVYAAK